MAKIIAILSGGDWNDASVEHFTIENIDLKVEHQAYRKIPWEEKSKMEFPTFGEWLVKNGKARWPNEEEFEEFDEVLDL